MYAIVQASAESTPAGIVTAFATIITAVGGVILAFSVLLPILRQTKAVHTMVNQQRTDAQRYQVALIAALEKAGAEVPVDQSKPVPTAVEPSTAAPLPEHGPG